MNEQAMLDQKIVRYLELKEQKARLEEEEKQVKADIECYMSILEKTEYMDNNENVVKIAQQTRSSLDSVRIKEFLGEKVSEYMKPTTFTVITVKTKEERERVKKFMNK